MISKIESINDYFRVPIYHIDDKKELNENIITDLELVKTIDSSSNCIYDYVFDISMSTCFSKKIIEQMPLYYTTDIVYLKETQDLLKKLDTLEEKEEFIKDEEILNIWDEIKNDTGFKEKYCYIDWPFWEFLNNSEPFLQFMSIYNMASPVFSLFIPVIILIVPFFIIKLKGLNLSVNEYIEVLKLVASNHALGKVFTHFSSVSLEQKMYIAISAAFYVFSIYQNILTCIRFHNNMKKIHNYLEKIQMYIDQTIIKMNKFLDYSKDLTSYKKFNETMYEKIEVLTFITDDIKKINNYKWSWSIKKIKEVGHVLKCFYQLYNNENYNSAIMYSFGFNGYLTNLNGLICNINNKKINYARFINNNTDKANKFKQSYYATLTHKKHVKNTIELKKNIIITGPNASGKTTILKTTLINIILTQQFGCGFYKSAKLKPYHYIHCYLNIPDTSGRDSLFQAEARRCKEIIDIINKTNNKENHICIFDELYSGTNPEEAVIGATAFMDYLVKNKNVSCLLTTHFIDVCKNLEKNGSIQNYHMETICDNNTLDFKYTYLIKKDISYVKGGIKILKDMNYPEEILQKIEDNKNL